MRVYICYLCVCVWWGGERDTQRGKVTLLPINLNFIQYLLTHDKHEEINIFILPSILASPQSPIFVILLFLYCQGS